MGEHVIKTYCKQQKVIALSSAEAELYAMVAASAETLALAAYARDLGLVLECELYCDSAAALGIAQRAGIGKVRHLRTQGLWVQEVRVSGRIIYKKVLGEKNPADLLTKHMPAELAGRHLKCLNMQFDDGRAESAPTLDSLVQAWYSRSGGDADSLQTEKRKVRFDDKIKYRPIPCEGRGRRTPPRGFRSLDREGRGLDMYEKEELHDSVEEVDVDMIDECKCDGGGLLTTMKWGDADDIVDDRICVRCARSWSTTRRRPSTTDGAPCSSLEVSGDVSPNISCGVSGKGQSVSLSVGPHAHLSAHSGSFDIIGFPHNRLASGGSPMRDPTRLTNFVMQPNLCAGNSACHSLAGAPCLMRRRRRRSVGSGPHSQRSHRCVFTWHAKPPARACIYAERIVC